jgi:ABC-type xylose transport system permease subunit
MTVRALWVVAVAMACVVVVGFVIGERTPAPKLAPVLVAKQLIPAGTPGRVVVARGMATVVTDVPAEVGAMPNASYLIGRVALHDVFPGQLVNIADFSAAP